MQRRISSREAYEYVQQNLAWATEDEQMATGWLSFQHSNTPVLAAELDEDSFFLAFSGWNSFVEHSLGRYAQAHSNIVASIYTFSTGQSPSVNPSRGEGHGNVGWHNACFLGVVGQDEENILDTIVLALTSQVGVPEGLVESLIEDPAKLQQISCRNPSEYIPFKSGPSWHVEDGRCWAPLEQNVWYTHEDWT